MTWDSPASQIWHAEVILLAALVWTHRYRDGRKYFQALMACGLAFDLPSLILVRTGHLTAFTNIAYTRFLFEIPLLALALIESADWRPVWHRTILCWWVAATVGCLGIRYFPYSGRALLLVNCAAYSAWIWKSLRIKA